MSAPIMNHAIMYHHAEVAAGWMDRGDDVNEAQAIRQLIAEHKALTVQRDELKGEVNGKSLAVRRANDRWYAAGNERDKAENERDVLLTLLSKAVSLYETYGLVAGNQPCGEWVNSSREAINGIVAGRLKTQGERDDLLATWLSQDVSTVETSAAQMAIIDHAIAEVKGGES